MLDIPTEMISGLVAAGFGFYTKMRAQEQANMITTVELALKKQEKDDDSANQAFKRSTDSFSRRFIVLCVVAVSFLGLVLAACKNHIPVTYLYEAPIKSYLMGLWTTGGDIKSITGNGLVLPPYVSHSVIAIIFFHFGAGAAKVKKY